MKTLNDYMAMSYRMEIVEDKDEGGFVVSYPDLPGCITCGETVESAVANALDANPPEPAPITGRTFAERGNQHESVLRIPSF